MHLALAERTQLTFGHLGRHSRAESRGRLALRLPILRVRLFDVGLESRIKCSGVEGLVQLVPEQRR